MCDYSLESVLSRPALVGFLRRKTSMLRFAYCPAQSCPSQTRLDGYVCGRGTPALSSTRPRSFARSIRAERRGAPEGCCRRCLLPSQTSKGT
jgi:hypothetical protein